MSFVSRHKHHIVVGIPLVVIVAFFAMQILASEKLYPDGTRLPAVIDTDFVLINRPWPPQDTGNGFWLKEGERLVIRDCTMYTRQLWAPPEMQVYAYGEDAGGIYVQDSAHLTLINVTVIPYAYISVCDHAIVELHNCTNHYNTWCTNGSAANVVNIQPEGDVAAQEHATVWIEGSKIGFLTVDYGSYVNCTVVDSFVDRALLNNRLPSRFVDSEVYEMHDPIGNVDLVGATTVAYRGYPWTGARMALQLSATLEKTDFLRGEPIAMTCHLRNVGGVNVTLFLSDGTDRFYLCAYQPPVSEDTTFQYFNRAPTPGPHTPTVVLPGETLEYTLVWETPSLLPGTYELEGSLESPTLYDALHACGFYTITISEEEWLG